MRYPLFRRFGLLLAAGLTLQATGAEAQGLFDFLGRLLGGPRFHQQQTDEAAGPGRIFCVRLCDGAFFPISPGKGKTDPQELCGSLCPSAATAVYRGSQIDNAVTEKGATYSSLENAFRYREHVAEQCSCTGRLGGTAVMDVRSDPTLKPGDYVVTAAGVEQFKGSKQFPHAATDFTAARLDNIVPAHPERSPVMSVRVHPRPANSQPEPDDSQIRTPVMAP